MNQKLELEQAIFKQSVNQLSHELKSPLASLAIVLDSCKNCIPEHKLIVLKEIVARINGILGSFTYQDNLLEEQNHPKKLVLISLILRNILDIKKNQYKDFPVKFINNFAHNCNFTFVDGNLIVLKKVLDMFIDKAVQSLNAREGVVSIDLELDHETIKIIIQDGGKGLTQEEVAQFMHEITDIHGIGFEIDSEIGIGTRVTLSLPKAKSPDWIVEKIYLNKGDKVVILDDDDSIYKAWKAILDNNQNSCCLQHFIFSHDAIDFINNYQEKTRILLLADFELLKQELNGVQVIQHANIQRSVLVTSHYADKDLLDIAVANGIKILPKQLISKVEIIMEDNSNNTDIVVIDDDKMFVEAVEFFLLNKGKHVNKYYSPALFLTELVKYDKNVKIFIDHDFKADINGIDLAKKLHEQGYKNLYLFSGKNFKTSEVPDYLTIITKTDINTFGKFISDS